MAEPQAIGASDETGRRYAGEMLDGSSEENSSSAKREGRDRDVLLLFSINMQSAVGCDYSTSLTEKDMFAIVCSKKLMRSWVSQPSPCCAAASVAGVLNALSTKEKPDWACAELLELYKSMTRERISRQKRLVQLQTGVTGQELADLEAAVGEQLMVSGELAFGGAKKILREQMLDAVSLCVKAGPSQFQVFYSVLTLNGPNSSGLDIVSSEGGDALNTSEHAGTSIAFTIGFRSSTDTKHRRKQLQDTLYQYLHLLDGLAKLQRPEKPSTAICGNEAILRAVAAVSASESDMDRLGLTGRRLQATVFMENITSAEAQPSSAPSNHQATWQISQADSPERREDAWVALWSEFARESTVLMYHLKNHYALVFAMREWREPLQEVKHEQPCISRQRREILTARKGQRPSTWIAWDEVYTTLCAWDGYKIISVSVK